MGFPSVPPNLSDKANEHTRHFSTMSDKLEAFANDPKATKLDLYCVRDLDMDLLLKLIRTRPITHLDLAGSLNAKMSTRVMEALRDTPHFALTHLNIHNLGPKTSFKALEIVVSLLPKLTAIGVACVPKLQYGQRGRLHLHRCLWHRFHLGIVEHDLEQVAAPREAFRCLEPVPVKLKHLFIDYRLDDLMRYWLPRMSLATLVVPGLPSEFSQLCPTLVRFNRLEFHQPSQKRRKAVESALGHCVKRRKMYVSRDSCNLALEYVGTYESWMEDQFI